MAFFDSLLGVVFLGFVAVALLNRFKSSSETASTPRHRVNEQALANLVSMFPHIPSPAIRYDLEKTGDSQKTAENILRLGYLEMPPGVLLEETSRTHPVVSSGVRSERSRRPEDVTLIDRYNLSSRLVNPVASPSEKTTWSSDKEARESSLRQRKEAMILKARQKMVERDTRRAEKGKLAA